MEKLLLIAKVAGLVILACYLGIAAVLVLCKLGSREAEQQLDPDSPLNYGRRHGDYPTHRCARRKEDDVRAQFEAGCG